MKLKPILLLMTASLTLFFTSCQKKIEQRTDKIENLQLNSEQQALKSRMEQRALITATAMKDDQLIKLFVQAVKSKIKAGENNDEAITFNEILKEQPSYVSAFAKKFKEEYGQIYYSHKYFHSYKFPAPVSPSKNNPSARTEGTNVYDELFVDNDGTQIYFPYSENFELTQVVDPAVTYYPLADLENVEAYKDIDIPDSLLTFIANEPYAIQNPTFVLNFEDIQGVDGIDGILNIDSIAPPPPAYSCNFLSYNTYSDVLDDRYVISVSIPQVKLLKNFRTWIGGSNYLTMLQCYVHPNNLAVNPQPALNPVDANERYVCRDFRIKRRHVGDWVSFNNVFNDDWRLVQYDNPMVIFSKQGWLYNPDAHVNVTASAGLKLDTVRIDSTRLGYKWTPSFNVGANASINLHLGSEYEYRGSDYITRRGLLANCVGDNFGNGTLTINGIPWTVRKISDVLQFALQVRECH